MITYPIYTGILGTILGVCAIILIRRAILIAAIKLFDHFDHIQDQPRNRPYAVQTAAGPKSSTIVTPVEPEP